VLEVSRWHYTLAGGSAGTAGLTPAQIEEKTEAVRERGRTTGRTMQVPAPIGERERKRYKEREKERVRERERVRSIL
jgi:hypothetical protein